MRYGNTGTATPALSHGVALSKYRRANLGITIDRWNHGDTVMRRRYRELEKIGWSHNAIISQLCWDSRWETEHTTLDTLWWGLR